MMARVFSYLLPLTSYLIFLTSCNNASVPAQFTDIKKTPKIYPDYVDVTIPVALRQVTTNWFVAVGPYSQRWPIGTNW